MKKNPKTPKKAQNNETIVEIIVEKIVEKQELQGIELYKELKAKGFPQGGQGSYYIDPKTSERFYKPTPDEIYNQFISDPNGWEGMVDAMVRVWIQNKK